MSAESVEFEQRVARIHQSLEDSGAIVTWDERIPDPDNPSQMRQIDISVRRGEKLTLVECRLHAKPQDVKWIEELYGRKASLAADSIIGVSSSGFTEGARLKAVKLGVFIRNLNEVSAEEVSEWGCHSDVRITFIQFTNVRLYVVASGMISIPTGADTLRTDKGEDFPIFDLLKGLSQKFANAKTPPPEGPITVEIKLKRVYLGMLPISEAFASFNWRVLRREVSLPRLFEYIDIKPKTSSTLTVVETNYHSETEVHHHEKGVFVTIDLSASPFADCCFLTGAEVIFEKPMTSIGCAVIWPEPRLDICEYQVEIVKRNTNAYKAIQKRVPISLGD